jgi:hypothetical protein
VSIKDRLLEALNDTGWNDLSTAALVEALADRLQQAKAELFEAQQAIFKEAQRAHEMQEDLTRQIHELRTSPLAAASGDFYFDGGRSGVFLVSVHEGRATLHQRVGRIDYPLPQIDRHSFVRLMASQI